MCPLCFLTPTHPDGPVRTLASVRTWVKDSA